MTCSNTLITWISVRMRECTSMHSCRTSIGTNATADWRKRKKCTLRFEVDANSKAEARTPEHAKPEKTLRTLRNRRSGTYVDLKFLWICTTDSRYAPDYRAGRR